MFSLESQIEPYTDASFSAEIEAQHFFKSYGEADISKKLQEMASIQQSIETVLRQKVRANYGMFLVANDEINQVDEEMSDLKHLISNTQKLIEDVQANRIDDSRAMRTNSFLGKFTRDEDQDQNDSVNAKNKAIADAKNSVPVWLAKAPEELAQFIVEQQYSKAVVIVLKTRAYVNTISHELHLSLNKNNTTTTASTNTTNTGSTTTNNTKNYRNSAAATQAAEIAAAVANAQTEAIIQVLNRIDELCVHLAGTIRKSILNLPTSALWGKTEQFRLLKLLIALEEFDMAAEGFEITQLNTIKKSLRLVEYSGDTVIYTSELSNSFFLALLNSCSIFKSLYHDYYERPEILNLLLVWLQKQISNYVEILIPQMHAGITDLSNNVLNSLRKACAAAAASVGPSSSSSVLKDSEEGFPDMDSIYGGGSGPTIQSIMEELVIKSPLNVLSGCLEGAYRAAHYIDGPQLQGSSCLGWILIPEVQLVVTAYAERFLDQVGAQVRQDSWQPVQLMDLAMRSPGKNSAPFEFIGVVEENGGEEGAVAQLDDPSQHPVSRSYEWLQAVLNHLNSEIWKLLKAEEEEDEQEPSRGNASKNTAASNVPVGGSSSDGRYKATAAGGGSANGISNTSPSYTRADVCEVESVAVGCMIRIFIRYIVEIEALTTKGFTKMQSNCYLKTLEALVTYMLPSIEHVTTTCYFAEGVNGLHASPSHIFKTLKPQLLKLLKERQR